MASITTIRAGLKTRLDAVTGLRAYAIAPGQISPEPGKAVAVVEPAPGVFLVRDSQGSFRLSFVVWLLVGSQLTLEGQKVLDAYLDTSSPVSVFAALEDDTSDLGGGGEYVASVAASSYGAVQYAGVTYFGAQLAVEVGAV